MRRVGRFGLVVVPLVLVSGAGAEEDGMGKPATIPNERQPVAVGKLATAPTVDGNLEEWGGEGWSTVAITPAMEGDSKNRTGSLEVKLKVGVAGDRVYFAATWPDKKADTEYRPWEWSGNKYKKGKDRDDMFVLRFDLGSDYQTCMFSDKDYKVDLWQWSAGRSDQAGVAEDYTHVLSTSELEEAAEYSMPNGKMIYIKKTRDAGDEVWGNTDPDPKQFQGDKLPGVTLLGKGSGSLVDVSAKGVWQDGVWKLELSRKLDTGDAGDRSFAGGGQVVGQLAVFNAGYSEHKSVSGSLLFDFAGAK